LDSLADEISEIVEGLERQRLLVENPLLSSAEISAEWTKRTREAKIRLEQAFGDFKRILEQEIGLKLRLYEQAKIELENQVSEGEVELYKTCYFAISSEIDLWQPGQASQKLLAKPIKSKILAAIEIWQARREQPLEQKQAIEELEKFLYGEEACEAKRRCDALREKEKRFFEGLRRSSFPEITKLVDSLIG